MNERCKTSLCKILKKIRDEAHASTKHNRESKDKYQGKIPRNVRGKKHQSEKYQSISSSSSSSSSFFFFFPFFSSSSSSFSTRFFSYSLSFFFFFSSSSFSSSPSYPPPSSSSSYSLPKVIIVQPVSPSE